MPSILFHRGTAWRGAVRGSTNLIARHFREAGYDVAWVTRPRHIGHLLREARSGAPFTLESGVRRWDDGVLEIEPVTVLPIVKHPVMGPRLWEASARLGWKSVRPSLPAIFKTWGQPPPDLVWTTGGDGGSLREAFPGARSVVQCVDVYEAYAGPTQNRLEVLDYRAADAVVSIGHALADFLAEFRGVDRGKITVIGQGADLDLFAEDHGPPADSADLPRPRLVWVGVLDKADPDLFAAALDALPPGQGSLVLIGPHAPWALDLAARDDRVRVLGPRLASEVASYLQNSDVGLMLYDRARPPLQYVGQNPLKLYEMAAAGLAIVSTPHAEYAQIQPPILVADSPGSVVSAVREAIADRDRMGHAASAFAQANSWRSRFDAAEQLVARLIGGSVVASA